MSFYGNCGSAFVKYKIAKKMEEENRFFRLRHVQCRSLVGAFVHLLNCTCTHSRPLRGVHVYVLRGRMLSVVSVCMNQKTYEYALLRLCSDIEDVAKQTDFLPCDLWKNRSENEE